MRYTCLKKGRSPCGERGLKCVFGFQMLTVSASLPVRGAWIEISGVAVPGAGSGRSPCGERGLKFLTSCANRPTLPSLPVRGAWIEIRCATALFHALDCRSPCGERGLKSVRRIQHHRREGRSPCGERGLKSLFFCRCGCPLTSLPVRGAWIEIVKRKRRRLRRSPSLPVRGAWIEIAIAGTTCWSPPVAPRAGSVD